MSAPTIDFFVPGLAATKGSAKGFGFIRKAGPRKGSIGVSIVNDNPRAKAWAATVSLAAHAAMAGKWPIEKPVRVEIDFFLPRPKSHYLRGVLRPTAPRHVATKPDGDKLVRCFWDALTRVAFVDDSQIVEWAGSKFYGAGAQVGARCQVWVLS